MYFQAAALIPTFCGRAPGSRTSDRMRAFDVWNTSYSFAEACPVTALMVSYQPRRSSSQMPEEHGINRREDWDDSSDGHGAAAIQQAVQVLQRARRNWFLLVLRSKQLRPDSPSILTSVRRPARPTVSASMSSVQARRSESGPSTTMGRSFSMTSGSLSGWSSNRVPAAWRASACSGVSGVACTAAASA